jgi:uncharacterized protein YbjT (DUF2867 family)
MRVLVLGAQGLIGAAVAARLARDGHAVTGVARTGDAAARRAPFVDWVRADITRLSDQAWRSLVSRADGVVNCAGALQNGPCDDLRAIHVSAIVALARACETSGVRRLVQISAMGVDTGRTVFSRSKREADDALRGFDLDWVILRPGLVLGPAAYGGSALLRGLAGFPGVIPITHRGSAIQVVSVGDVAEAVARALGPGSRSGYTADLGASAHTSVAEVLTALRAWLGFPRAPLLALPGAIGGCAALAADGLAFLGWRSPMRSTAMDQLRNGVSGDTETGSSLIGFTPKPLEAILADWPSGVQERWFARLYFVKPLGLAALAIFWTASGLIGLVHLGAAATVLEPGGFTPGFARALALAGALADLALGLMVCVRRTARLALMGMIAVSAAYLAAASLWRPELWGDPLGPMLKVLPATVLVLAILAMMDDR